MKHVKQWNLNITPAKFMISMNVHIHIVHLGCLIIIPNYYIFVVTDNCILSINAIHHYPYGRTSTLETNYCVECYL